MRKNLNIIIISLFLAAVVWTLISLSYEYTAELTFEIHITAAGRNLSPNPEGANKVYIKCRAGGWQLLRLMFTEGNEFTINSEKNFDRDSVVPEKYLDQNQWLTSNATVLSISPEKIKVNVEAIKRKRVPVKEEGPFSFKQGYGIAGKPEITPDTVEIYGPASSVSSVQFIETYGEIGEELESKTELQRKLKFPSGVNSDVKEVKVILPVQQIVDKELTGVQVIIKGVPKDRNILLNPSAVSVSVRGGIDIVSALKSDDIIVSYDYSALLKDSVGIFQANAITTAPVEILLTNPRYIRFIIKKY